MKSIKFIIGCLLLASVALQSPAMDENVPQIVLTLKNAQLQLQQAESDYSTKEFKRAHAILKQLRPHLSQTTELHSQIYTALKDDSKAEMTSNQERRLTIEFAKLRDRANYLSGKVSRSQGYEMEAIKHFVQVIQSQRTTELGKMAYGQLKEMGFSPYLNLQDQI